MLFLVSYKESDPYSDSIYHEIEGLYEGTKEDFTEFYRTILESPFKGSRDYSYSVLTIGGLEAGFVWRAIFDTKTKDLSYIYKAYATTEIPRILNNRPLNCFVVGEDPDKDKAIELGKALVDDEWVKNCYEPFDKNGFGFLFNDAYLTSIGKGLSLIWEFVPNNPKSYTVLLKHKASGRFIEVGRRTKTFSEVIVETERVEVVQTIVKPV